MWNAERYFGYLEHPFCHGGDVFFHGSALTTERDPVYGDAVQFKLDFDDDKDRLEAYDVHHYTSPEYEPPEA